MSQNDLIAKAHDELSSIITGELSKEERAALMMEFIKKEEVLILERHREGAGGLDTASSRSSLIDAVLNILFTGAVKRHCNGQCPDAALIAQGGYGRGHLNPGSDLDLLFLLPNAADKISPEITAIIEEILYVLWDAGFKVGHACRSIEECIEESGKDQQNKTAMMDARLIVGKEDLYLKFQEKFNKECTTKAQDAFFDLRREDLRRRHSKYWRTVFLQEPHVKESCGGLRDFQNVLWVARAKLGFTSLDQLVEAKIITKSTCQQLREGYDFIHRVRNELHYETGRSTDILTLRFQGIVATNFHYPQKTILRRCEEFMRDYYRHSRAIYTHSTSLMEYFEIEMQDNEQRRGFLGIPLPSKKAKVEHFDGFYSKNGRIFLDNINALEEDPSRLMRLFKHCQVRSLILSPQARKYIHIAATKIDKSFRYDVKNREIFQSILEYKGDVAHILRLMHRTKVLDFYMPEFGAMDCLVQHEFFHRYTADEHTLRCIDMIDSLTDKPKEGEQDRSLYRKLFANVEDPYTVYLAILLHDSGRAENVREHIDGSTILADKVCRRLQVTGERRRLLMFLVDHHLTFWRYATSRNLDDLSVIEEFAGLMKHKSNLDTLLLFTWADSNGTNDEAWTPWKETLMLQLYRATRNWMENGKEQFKADLTEQKQTLLEGCGKLLAPKYHKEMERHFKMMPSSYFRFRISKNISIHIKSISKFLAREKESKAEDFACDISWIEREDKSHTEIVVTAWNRPMFLEKVCCALASQNINIIGADVYTRHDGVVCDIFQVCTPDHEPVTSERDRDRVYQTFCSINQGSDINADYQPEKYLKTKKNIFRTDSSEGGIAFPTDVHVSNDQSPECTSINIQALDHIGLLHDLFAAIDELGLTTVHARICTEKGAAMNSIYVTWPDGAKVLDEDKHREIELKISQLVDRSS